MSEDAKEKKSIANETCHRLSLHAQIEKELFYPPLRGMTEKLDEMLDEAKVEYAVTWVITLRKRKVSPAIIKSGHLRELANSLESCKLELLGDSVQ